MAEGTIKIKEMEELTELTDNDYFVVDNLQSGVPTKKYKATRVIQMIENVADEIEEKITPSIDTALAIGSASGDIASFSDGSTLPMPSLKVGIEPIQSGSGDPSPENVRPISGWSEANVSDVGKNLVNISDKTMTSSGYVFAISGLNIRKGIYTFSAKTTTSASMSIAVYGNGVAFINTGFNGKSISFTATDTITDIRLYTSGAGTYEEMMLEEGSTATSYEPYNRQTYNIQFKDGDNPLTVYGGTLDVVSGELVVDRANVLFNGSENWVNGGASSITGVKEFIIANWRENNNARLDTGIANFLTKSTTIHSELNAFRIGNDFNVAVTFVSDVASLKTYLASKPLQVVYELATPLTYQLTPTQVKSLLGSNNVWADTGEIIDCEYKRDATAIINSLIARIEALENQ